MTSAKPFRSVSLQREDDPNETLKAFGDRNIFVMTREVYLPMTDGVCRPIPCRIDNYEDHYPLEGVGIYKTPRGRSVLFAHYSHTELAPLMDREDAMLLSTYKAEFHRFWKNGKKLQASLLRLKTELQEHFKPILKLAEQTLHYDLRQYGLSLAKNRHTVHRRLFRQILNSEVDFSPCLRETFCFVRKTPLRDASRSKNLWSLRHALSTIKTILRCLIESIRAYDIIMTRIKDIIRWEQDHGHKPEFKSVEKGSPLMLDHFHAEGWHTKISAFYERCNEEWQSEKQGKGTQKAVSEHSERSIVHGLSRKLSNDTVKSISIASERERRPYAQGALSGLARKISIGSLRKPAAHVQKGASSNGMNACEGHRNEEKAREDHKTGEYRVAATNSRGSSSAIPARMPGMTSTRKCSMLSLKQAFGSKLARGK